MSIPDLRISMLMRAGPMSVPLLRVSVNSFSSSFRIDPGMVSSSEICSGAGRSEQKSRKVPADNRPTNTESVQLLIHPNLIYSKAK
ncbi:MAG TPA: hypothetical protein DEP18_08010 [Flavobacteriales bacterium]|nr:hypothetical protein [Flavobacteriales bacterium]